MSSIKCLVFIEPGPVYDWKDPSLTQRFEGLSKFYSGYYLTTGPNDVKLSIGNFTIFCMKSNHTFKSNISFFIFCKSKCRYLIKNNINISLVSSYDPLKTGLIAYRLAKILNAKFATEVNGVYTSPDEWVDNQGSISNKLKKIIYPWIMHFVLSRADGIRLLFPSQIDPFKNIVRGKIIRDFRRSVDTELFTPLKETNEILFVGFPFRRKGLDVLIEAFKKVACDYPEWKLKIIGWYPDLTELKLAINGHKQIIYLKPVKAREIAIHIGSCGIFVLPSRSEAMGRVLLEAMAAGKPRIGSRVDGIPLVIEDGVDGLLCQPGNVEDLAQKLILLIKDDNLRRKMGEAGRQRAKREFTHEIYMNNLLLFYSDVINSTNK